MFPALATAGAGTNPLEAMMGRPSSPLVIKQDALEAALAIIDADGLEAFSVRRLADELGVTGPSIYHHFGSKAELIAQVAELALSSAWEPRGEGDSWQDWLRASAHALRAALVRHPALVPLSADPHAAALMARMLGTWAARLMEQIPAESVLPLLEPIIQLAVGSAVHHAAAARAESPAGASQDPLGEAERTRAISSRDCFGIAVDSVLIGLGNALPAPTADVATSGAEPPGGDRKSVV